jgi:predicted  nucleic acid-binding Zn-ribbon protein
MSTSNPFEAFIALVDIDCAKYSSQKKVAEADKQRQILYAQKEQLHDKHSVCDQNLKKKKLLLITVQKDIAEHEKLLASKKEAQGRAQDRASKALAREVMHMQKEIERLEDSVLSLASEIEHTEKELTVISQELHGVDAQIITFDEQYQKIADSMIAETAQLEEQKKLYVSLIDPVLLHEYERMLTRAPNPVVEVVAGSCPVCAYALSHNEILALARHARVTCRGCYRFLYQRSSQLQTRVQ